MTLHNGFDRAKLLALLTHEGHVTPQVIVAQPSVLTLDGSASALEREIACPASAVLPKVLDVHDDDDRDRGTEIHKFVYNIQPAVGMSVKDALALVPEQYREVCSLIRPQKLLGGMNKIRGEVSYAISFGDEKAREIGINIGRNYPVLGPLEVPGTLDLEGESMTGTPVVADVKTGQDVTPAADNPQIKFQARARQLRTGKAVVRGELRYVRSSGYIQIDGHDFNTFELECFEDEVLDLAQRVQSARAELSMGRMPTVHPGRHCKYCPCMPACPEYAALAKSMLSDLTTVELQISTLSLEQAGAAWAKLKSIQRLAERVEDSLKAMAAQEPLPLPDGKEVRPIQIKKTGFDKAIALNLLRLHGATEAEIESCEKPRTETHYKTLKKGGR